MSTTCAATTATTTAKLMNRELGAGSAGTERLMLTCTTRADVCRPTLIRHTPATMSTTQTTHTYTRTCEQCKYANLANGDVVKNKRQLYMICDQSTHDDDAASFSVVRCRCAEHKFTRQLSNKLRAARLRCVD